MANRHLARSVALQTLFEWDFNGYDRKAAISALERNVSEFAPGVGDSSFATKLVEGVLEKQTDIDLIIGKAAPEWPLLKIATIDRNILRIGLFELLFTDRTEVPPKVAINESIELAKTFGGESSSKFVNGVLGTVYKELGEPDKDAPKRALKKEAIPYDKLPVIKLGGAVVFARDRQDIYMALVHDIFGHWTLSKGKIEESEDEEKATIREIKEELGVNSNVTFLGSFTGKSSFDEYEFPIITFAYLTEIDGEVKLDKKENSSISWVFLKDLKTIAFDSNQKLLKFVQDKFVYDLRKVKELVTQLDPSATVNEDSLYKAILNGYISKIELDGELAGMGWIFPRQTLLRKQAVVEDMIVNEKFRGQGLGEKILLDLIEWARKQGVEVIELTTNPKRVAANSLYQKVGFKLHPTNHYLLKL